MDGVTCSRQKVFSWMCPEADHLLETFQNDDPTDRGSSRNRLLLGPSLQTLRRRDQNPCVLSPRMMRRSALALSALTAFSVLSHAAAFLLPISSGLALPGATRPLMRARTITRPLRAGIQV